MRSLFLIISFVTLIIVSQGWATSDEDTDLRLKSLYDSLRCPTCQGLSVKDSEASFSIIIRNKVEEMVLVGATDEEIMDYFVERYGVWILRSPPKEGFNLLLWLLPGIVIVGCAIFMVFKMRAWVIKQRSESQDMQPITTEEQSLIEKDIKKFQDS